MGSEEVRTLVDYSKGKVLKEITMAVEFTKGL